MAQHAARQPKDRREAQSGRPAGGAKEGGELRVLVVDNKEQPYRGKALVLVTEHRPAFARQHRIDVDSSGSAKTLLEAGTYSVQVVAPDHLVGRGTAEVRAGDIFELLIRLVPGKTPSKDFAARLKVYGIEAKDLELADLTVNCGERVTLDALQHRDRRAYTVLRPSSIDDMKRWVGTPDGAFGHDKARFGPVPKLEADPAAGLEAIDRESMPALRAIATEYLHGNSKAVKRYEPLLSALLASRADFVSVFHFNVVTINDGAVLEIGKNSNVFACDILNIHQNGTLAIVGDVRADIGSYRVFH